MLCSGVKITFFLWYNRGRKDVNKGFDGRMGTRLIPIFFRVVQRLLDIAVVSLRDHWPFPK